MSDEKATEESETLCKMVRLEENNPEDEILSKPVNNLKDWVDSVNRCTAIADQRLDLIEKKIFEKSSD